MSAFLCIAAQCNAVTKKGTQCKRQASQGSEFCWQHGGRTKAQIAAGMTDEDVAKGRCKAITKAGTQCKRNAQTGSQFCWQHAECQLSAESTVEDLKETQTVGKKSDAIAKTTTTAKSSGGAVGDRTQCCATTKSGKRCSRKAQPGSDKCWQHQ